MLGMLLYAVVDCAGSNIAVVNVSFVLTPRDDGELCQRCHARPFQMSLHKG